jgi:hypothetical protein
LASDEEDALHANTNVSDSRAMFKLAGDEDKNQEATIAVSDSKTLKGSQSCHTVSVRL